VERKMRANRTKTIFVLCVSFVLFYPQFMVNAQATKIAIADIYANPNKFDWQMVQVEGKVLFVKSKTCPKGDYTTLELDDNSGKSLTIFSYGHFPIKPGDYVKVTGIYKKVIHVPPRYTFYNEIDATGGSIEKLK
jgi:hypothetical protein